MYVQNMCMFILPTKQVMIQKGVVKKQKRPIEFGMEEARKKMRMNLSLEQKTNPY